MIVARRPGALATPQFWAEDGVEWYARAYNASPWQALSRPYGGYLQMVPRVAGLASQLVDLAYAPLLLTLCAVLIQALVPLFLLSSRFEQVIPGPGRRFLVGLLLLAAPNLMEVHANVTNSHVHLAMLAFLVIVAQPRASRYWRAFDVICLLASGSSGPFCLLLLPAAALWWLHERSRWSWTRLLIVLATSGAQLMVLLQVGPGSRGGSIRSLGASPAALLDILGGQVFVGGITGVWTYAELRADAFVAHPWLPWLVGVLGVAFVARAALVTSSVALRVFLLFATLHLMSALTSPTIIGDGSLWQLLSRPGAGQRYYYFAILAFLATLPWTAAADPRLALRCAARRPACWRRRPWSACAATGASRRSATSPFPPRSSASTPRGPVRRSSC